MKRLVCEMCGSTDLIKQDGVFVCQSCGCKYSVEEAKKMMVEGTVEVTGTVKVDNSAAIDNYMQLATNAMSTGNNEEAEEYANKIIELDPHQSDAWIIKGEAAGWQTTGQKSRMLDAVKAWVNAVEFAAEDKKTEIRQTVAEKFTTILYAVINMHLDLFSKFPNAENMVPVINETKSCISMMNILVTNAGVSFNRGKIYTIIANNMNNGACHAWNTVKGEFGPGHDKMSKWQFDRFIQNGECCASLYEEALCYCRDINITNKILNNIITVRRTIRDSKSWKLDPFLMSISDDPYVEEYHFDETAKASRNKEIGMVRKQKDLCTGEKMADFINQISGSKKQEEAAYAKEKYWAEHSEEKLKLESEIENLSSSIAGLNNELESLPSVAKAKKIQIELDKLQEQMKSLGRFKGKEKKELQKQIDDLSQELSAKTAEAEKDKKPLQKQIDRQNNRVADINKELEKNRGYLSPDSRGYSITDIIRNGTFILTPKTFADYISILLPKKYKCTGISGQNSSFPGFGSQLKINIINSDAESYANKIGVNVFCTAEDENSPIQNIILEDTMATPRFIIRDGAKFINTDGVIKKAKDFVTIGTCILMTLFPNLAQSEVELQVIDLLYGQGNTYLSHEGIRIEYVETETLETASIAQIIIRNPSDYVDGIIIRADN